MVTSTSYKDVFSIASIKAIVVFFVIGVYYLFGIVSYGELPTGGPWTIKAEVHSSNTIPEFA